MEVQEPLLMPYQDQPFNGDQFVCEQFVRLRNQYKISTVVELGSCLMGSTKWLGNNFDKVITIEINDQFRQHGLKRIEGQKNVQSLLGDTVDLLSDVLSKCGDDTLIFIDSHWYSHNPMIQELQIIKNSGLKPVLVIHDMKVPEHPELGFDTYPEGNIVYEWEWIKGYITDIYGDNNYQHYYNSEATEASAKRGVLYVTPINTL